MQNDTTGQHHVVLKPSAGADVVIGLCRIEISHLSPQTDRKQHLDGCADIDTSAELSGKQLTTLVAKIKATGVKAIFSESSLPPKTAEAIGRQAGVKVEAGENSLYGDTLGPAGSAGATYLDMEHHNTTTIVDALKG